MPGFLDALYEAVRKGLDEYFKTQSQTHHTDQLQEEKRLEARMWEQRVNFITELREWETRALYCLLSIEDDEKLLLEASSSLFEEVEARQSDFLNVWRSSLKYEDPLQRLRDNGKPDTARPVNSDSPLQYAVSSLKKLSNQSGQPTEKS